MIQVSSNREHLPLSEAAKKAVTVLRGLDVPRATISRWAATTWT